MTAPASLFPPAELMTTGVYYYPEAWPPDEWPRDFAAIRLLGFEFVHLGEFAWALLEPAPGRFDFAWLDRALALAAENDLQVVLCTPTAAPPAWLTAQDPEVLMVDAAGRRQRHGTRQHACWNVPRYRDHVARIVGALAARYARDPRVRGWQLDNELCHYGKEPCHCDACQAAFRVWLEARYTGPAALNAAWGAAFWSQLYSAFAQVRLPNPAEAPAQLNPHALLDTHRWFAASAADYLRFQTGLLRAAGDGRQWITTNYIHHLPAVDPALNAPDFDLVTWTHYPAAGQLNRGPLGFRLGDPNVIGFAGDRFRCLNGAHGVMELQPGQVNWGDCNPQPHPGAVHHWIFRAFATGAKLLCTYRYRQPRSGAELYHHGIVGPDGVTLSPGGADFVRALRDVAALRPAATPGAPLPPALAARRAGLFHELENRWDLDDHKQHRDWDTVGHLLHYHRALTRLGAPVDVVGPAADFSVYPFLVVPAAQLVDPDLVERWRRYAAAGGHLVLSCRTAQKDRRGHLWAGPWAAPLVDLIGASIRFYDTLPPPHVAHVRLVAENSAAPAPLHAWTTWGEILDPLADVPVTPLARHADQFYAGELAALTRAFGRGTVTYIGVDSTSGEFEAALLRTVYTRAAVPVLDLPEGFLVGWRDGLWIATNSTALSHPIPAAPDAKLLLGTREVPPAGVAVWRDRCCEPPIT